MKEQPVVSCVDVSRRFIVRQGRRRSEEVVALDSVSFDVLPGRFVALAGPSGSGKSTLLALLGALDHPTRGSVMVGGVDVGSLGRRERRAFRRRRALTMLPQPADNLLLARTAHDNIVDAARQRGQRGDLGSMADDVLARLGLEALATRVAGTLSGGEQQRIALACCLVGRAAVVLPDEPTGALDRASAATVIAALRQAVDDGASIVVATHDDDVIAAADQVIRLDHGRRVL